MNRLCEFKAVLPNGKTVRVVVPPPSEHPRTHSDTTVEALATLLNSDRPSEADLFAFLCPVIPVVFPHADPSEPLRKQPILSEGQFRPDIVYRVRDSSDLGLVELKGTHTYNGTSSMRSGLSQLRAYVVAARKEWGSAIAEASLIIGRGQAPIHSVPAPDIDFNLALLTWDDVISRIKVSQRDTDQEEPEYTVLLVDLIQSSRRMLRLLSERFELFVGLDDRRFEEIVATLLHDVGFHSIELTPMRKDKGRDIVARHRDSRTGQTETYYIECKHWVSGNKVTMRWALSLLDVVTSDAVSGGILLSSSGFGPRLLEQRAELATKGIRLRSAVDLAKWLTVWERTYAGVLLKPVDPLALFEDYHT